MLQVHVYYGITSSTLPVGFAGGKVPVPSRGWPGHLTLGVPVLPPVPQQISLCCKAQTDHCRLQSLSASKWPFSYLKNHSRTPRLISRKQLIVLFADASTGPAHAARMLRVRYSERDFPSYISFIFTAQS